MNRTELKVHGLADRRKAGGVSKGLPRNKSLGKKIKRNGDEKFRGYVLAR